MDDTLIQDLPNVEESEYARRFGAEIGSGGFRKVYRVPGSRWAYKFERTRWKSGNGANAQEFRNFTAFRKKLPEGVEFPEMALLDNGAIAVEFVEGVHGRDTHDYDDNFADICNCTSHRGQMCWKAAVQNIDMKDLHGKNVMLRKSDGKVIIIDIGEYGDDS